jgi:PPOX class probable F420-dependent enzyme
MLTDEERKFLQAHRLCVVGIGRGEGAPSLSPVYYVMDGDDILISTTATRAKARAVRRNPAISICALGEQPPFPYLTVYGTGRIEDEGAADLMLRIGAAISGETLPEAARPAIAERARTEGRVVLRVTPERTFFTAPWVATA